MVSSSIISRFIALPLSSRAFISKSSGVDTRVRSSFIEYTDIKLVLGIDFFLSESYSSVNILSYCKSRLI